MGPTRAQQLLQLREEAGGEVTWSWLCNIGGADWKGLADSGKISRVRVQTWACWTGWEISVAVSCPKLRQRLRATRGGGFVARSVRNYNRGKWYGGTSVSCQTNALQEKMYTNINIKLKECIRYTSPANLEQVQTAYHEYTKLCTHGRNLS